MLVCVEEGEKQLEELMNARLGNTDGIQSRQMKRGEGTGLT